MGNRRTSRQQSFRETAALFKGARSTDALRDLIEDYEFEEYEDRPKAPSHFPLSY